MIKNVNKQRKERIGEPNQKKIWMSIALWPNETRPNEALANKGRILLIMNANLYLYKLNILLDQIIGSNFHVLQNLPMKFHAKTFII